MKITLEVGSDGWVTVESVDAPYTPMNLLVANQVLWAVRAALHPGAPPVSAYHLREQFGVPEGTVPSDA